MPRVRHRLRGSAAAPVLVQQSLRRLSDLSRVRQHHRARHGSGRARQDQVDPAGRHRALEQAALSLAARGAEARGQEEQAPAGRAVGRTDRRGEAVRRRGLRRCGRRRTERPERVQRALQGHPGILPVARSEEIQGSRARVSQPLPGIPHLSGLRRRAAAARGARRSRRRPHHRSRVGADGPGGARLLRQPRDDRQGSGDRREGAEGNSPAAVVSERRRARLPDAGSPLVHAVGRGSAADQPGDVARLGAGRDVIRARRAVHRAALARQPAADRDPSSASRPGQHGHRRRARRRHDQGRRPHRRSGPRGGRAGRARRVLRHARRADARVAIADGEVSAPGAGDSDCADAAARHGAEDPAARRDRTQPQGHRRQHSR